jgi:hypothetical protein
MNRRRIKEAGDMIASQPSAPLPSEPGFIELLAREVEKLNGLGKLSPLVYNRALNLLPILRTSILNIYGRRESGLQQALVFLLKQAGRLGR